MAYLVQNNSLLCFKTDVKPNDIYVANGNYIRFEWKTDMSSGFLMSGIESNAWLNLEGGTILHMNGTMTFTGFNCNGYDTTLVVDGGTATLSYDGYSASRSVGDYVQNSLMFLCAWNYLAQTCTFYYFKIYGADDTLLYNFVPCKNGIKDKVSGTELTNSQSGTFTVYDLFDAEPTYLGFDMTGETKTSTITSEGPWTASTDADYLTLSQNDDVLTVTASDNSGNAARKAVISLVDADGNTASINTKQKGVGGGKPFYIGDTEIPSVYLGSTEILAGYLGENEVFSNAPFVGLKTIPASVSLSNAAMSKEVKIKATDGMAWTISNVPDWLTLSATAGTGTTKITITASETEEDRNVDLTIAGGEYTVTLPVNDKALTMPLDEVWYYATSTGSWSELYTWDADGNSLTYTHTFSDGKGILKFSGEPYSFYLTDFNRNVGVTQLWLPYGVHRLVQSNGDTNPMFYYCNTLEKFCGDCQLIVDNGNAILCTDDGQTVNNNGTYYDGKTVICCTAKANTGTLTIPEGVVSTLFYSSCASAFGTIIVPSTLTVFEICTWENAAFDTMYCYSTTPPTCGNLCFYAKSNAITLHAPVGTDYSSFPYSNKTVVYDL